jgi:hypothetical protein
LYRAEVGLLHALQSFLHLGQAALVVGELDHRGSRAALRQALAPGRKSGSQEPPRWRERDSNPRSPDRKTTLRETASRGIAHLNVRPAFNVS